MLGAGLILCSLASPARADVVEMQNGDRYVGQVVSLGADTLVVQSEVLGKLELPRARVALIGLGANAATNLARVRPAAKPQPRAPSVSATNSGPDMSRMLRQLGLSTNLVQQVQKQFLGEAGPEAKDKFNELLSGYMTGKLNLEDIRSQARSAADQIRALKKDLGEDTGSTLDAYLGILDRFLKEGAPAGAGGTNAPAAWRSKPEAAEQE